VRQNTVCFHRRQRYRSHRTLPGIACRGLKELAGIIPARVGVRWKGNGTSGAAGEMDSCALTVNLKGIWRPSGP